jgi:membrane protease YdiL (CAAX protease family)
MTTSTQTIPKPKAPLLTLFGIGLALATPLITWFLDGYYRIWFDRNGKVLAGALSFWVIVGLILLLIRYDEGQPLRSIGIKRLKNWQEGVIALIIDFVTLGCANVAFVLLARTIFPTNLTGRQVFNFPLPLVILLFLTGSVVEEILYRGYALERLQALTGNWWLSGGVTWALFVAFHVPAYPMAHIVGYVAPAALVATLAYIWKRNLLFTIIIHGCLNLPIVLAAILAPLVQ